MLSNEDRWFPSWTYYHSGFPLQYTVHKQNKLGSFHRISLVQR
jgi:hypothetical protein